MSTIPEAESTAQAVWFYEEKGERLGPSTESQIARMIRTSRIAPGALVWRSGFADWLRVENTELAAYIVRTGPPPLAGQHVDNTLTWTLAVAPILGTLVEYFVAGAVMRNEYAAEEAVDAGRFFLITVALNVVLSYMDETRVRAAGHDTSKFRGLTWLVPVYLFQRAKLLDQSPAYFWVWIACFVLTLL